VEEGDLEGSTSRREKVHSPGQIDEGQTNNDMKYWRVEEEKEEDEEAEVKEVEMRKSRKVPA
jgi:hypothetical protein